MWTGPPDTGYSELQAGPSARVGYLARGGGEDSGSRLGGVLLAPGTLDLVQAAGPSTDGASPSPLS